MDLKKHNYTHVWFDSDKICKLCGKTLENYVGVINHLEREHSEVPLDNIAKIKCSDCQKMFKTENGLRLHMSARHGDCKYKFLLFSYDYSIMFYLFQMSIDAKNVNGRSELNKCYKIIVNNFTIILCVTYAVKQCVTDSYRFT